jgi:putative membrane protein
MPHLRIDLRQGEEEMKGSTLKRQIEMLPFLVTHRPGARRRGRSVGKGLIAGLVGGLVGTIVMTQFQNAWSSASEALKNEGSDQEPQQQQGQQQSEDATMKAAGKIAELAGHRLSHREKEKFGPVIHYGFGTVQGAVYGVITEMAGVQGGFSAGLSFGAALFVVADELTVPALGLSGKPSESPLSSHLYGLASHLVYGVAAEVTRRGLRAAL